MEILLKRLTKTGSFANEIIYLTQQKSYTFGRQSNNDIMLYDLTVSRKHCIFHHNSDGLFLQILTGVKSISINGKKQAAGSKVRLNNNDLVRMSSTYKYRLCFEATIREIKNEIEDDDVQIKLEIIEGDENAHSNRGINLKNIQWRNCYVDLGKRDIPDLEIKSEFLDNDSTENELQNAGLNRNSLEVDEQTTKSGIKEVPASCRRKSLRNKERGKQNNKTKEPQIDEPSNGKASEKNSPEISAEPLYHSAFSEEPTVAKKLPRIMVNEKIQPKITNYFRGNENKKKEKESKNSHEKKIIPSTDKIKYIKEAEPEEYTCADCGNKFQNRIHLKKHLLQHFLMDENNIRVIDFQCEICKKILSCNVGLKEHLMRHSKLKPFSCDKCDQSFVSKSELRKHYVRHTGNMRYSCNICDKKFRYPNILKGHMNTHTGERPFVCDDCGKNFPMKRYLVTHIKSHNAEKPYSCSKCKSKFSSRSYLKKHRATHTFEKPFVCTICYERFGWSNSLKTHMLRHEKRRPFPCTKCEKAYLLKTELNAHWKAHHEDKFSCTTCDKKFAMLRPFRLHMATHTGQKTFSCSECDKTFLDRSWLHKHRLRKHSLRKNGEKIISNAMKNFRRRAF